MLSTRGHATPGLPALLQQAQHHLRLLVCLRHNRLPGLGNDLPPGVLCNRMGLFGTLNSHPVLVQLGVFVLEFPDGLEKRLLTQLVHP